MVGVKFNGRLGNQLFQFYFLQYLKSYNKDKSFFFTNPHHAYLTKYFDFDARNNFILGSKPFTYLVRLVARIANYDEIYIQNIQVPRKVDVKNNTVYKGFFQTDFYIRNTPDPVPLKLKKPFTDAFQAQFGSIFNSHKTVVVHIRRTDYMNYGKRDISLPMEYFKQRLDAIENLDDYKVFFVSDDMEHVKEVFEEKPNFIFSANSEIIDFQLIMNADIAIISNSSFAWWATYSSPKQNTVYAPKNWLGFRIGKEHPKKVMTDKFIWCDVI